MKLYKKSLVSKSLIDHEKYKQYCNAFQKIKRKAKHDFYYEQCVSFKNNTKQLWKMINTVTNKVVKNQTVMRSIKIGKIEETNKEVISNTLCKYFATIGMTFAKKVNPSNVPIENYLSKIKPNKNSIYICLTNPSKVLTIINNLVNKKSSGWDGVSNSMLKELKNLLCQPLSLMFNTSISTGVFPSIFKKADVIPLHKSGSTNESTNYRPISLLVTMSKILEKLIYKCV